MTGAASFLVIGNTSADQVFTLDHPVAKDGKVAARSFAVYPGGQAANVAATLALLGQTVRFAGPFGDDVLGRDNRAALTALGVDLTLSPTVSDCRHHLACILVSGAARSIISYKDDRLTLDGWLTDNSAARDAVKAVRAVFTDGFEVPASLRLAAAAKDLSKPVFADMEIFVPGSLDLVAMVDHLIAPADIIRQLGENDDLGQALAHVKARGPQAVVATCGASGSVGLARGMTSAIALPSIPCDVVDTTGAGDAYHAGYLAAWADGAELEDCMRVATEVAAVKCAVPGPRLTPLALSGLTGRSGVNWSRRL